MRKTRSDLSLSIFWRTGQAISFNALNLICELRTWRKALRTRHSWRCLLKTWSFGLASVFLLLVWLFSSRSTVLLSKIPALGPSEPLSMLLVGCGLIYVAGRMKKLRGNLDVLKLKILQIQHRLNPLHVYCRLVERGLNKRLSVSICRSYEICIYSWLSWLTVVTVQICKVVKPVS